MRRGSAPSKSGSFPGFRPPSSQSGLTRSNLIPTTTKQVSIAGPKQQQHENNKQSENSSRYFTAIWCKQSSRKHKKYEDDALLIVRANDRLAILKDTNGKEIGRGSGMAIAQLAELGPGGEVSFGGKEVQILDEITHQQFLSQINNEPKIDQENEEEKVSSVIVDKTMFKPFSAPKKFGASFPTNLNRNSGFTTKQITSESFVLPRPPFGSNFSHDDIVDVVVDNHLAKMLRPHQKEGVLFLYRCVMGFNDNACCGAILADEMGLGKTLQTITLIWTMMRQNPNGKLPIIRRSLILAPSSLIGNWQNEFKKWLGTERINVFAVDLANRITEYIKNPILPVLIMSYEMFVKNFDDLQRVKFDLIVCDEGHRLKNEKVKASNFLSQMLTEKRIVLTGTPLQNDLKEFYAIVCAVNPNIFGTAQNFARRYEEPILRSKQPEATDEEKEDGEMRMNELSKLSSQFILRRTQDIIRKFLPPKSEYVVFCRPSELQGLLYERACCGDGFNLTNTDSACILTRILQLRKICNHPVLASESLESENIPPQLLEQSLEAQGSKLGVVSFILHELRTQGKEKIVLVSISTRVLDLLEELCSFYQYPCLRLDGSTQAQLRQKIVQRFNSKHGDEFVLLLSSKAGGTGLNLIGASRILLYDMDWNPAHDIQAMARVWRDGQTKPVVVYRLVTAGTIEEKIFQRQITKQGLGGGLMEESAKSSQFHFTKEELKDLFTFSPDSKCNTHDLLGCSCQGQGLVTEAESSSSDVQQRTCQLGGVEKKSEADLQDLLNWTHIDPECLDIGDECLECSKSCLTFALKKNYD